MVHEMDRSVGRVVTALKNNNMLENTIIVFSGDNGGAVNGYGGNMASNWPLRGVNHLYTSLYCYCTARRNKALKA